MSSKIVEEWLAQDFRINVFEETGDVDDSFYDEWGLYEAIKNKLKEIPSYISKKAMISPSAEIMGNVVIEEGAEILPYSVIKGPAYIGKNVVVGNFSFIRPFTFLSRETLLGNHSYCNEVVSAPKCRASHYVGCSRSVLMKNCTLSSFVLTATLRADYKPVIENDDIVIRKRGCVIGSNTYLAPHVTVSPGMRIGKNCFIGSYITISKDVGDNKFIKADISIVEKENPVIVGERMFNSVME